MERSLSAIQAEIEAAALSFDRYIMDETRGRKLNWFQKICQKKSEPIVESDLFRRMYYVYFQSLQRDDVICGWQHPAFGGSYGGDIGEGLREWEASIAEDADLKWVDCLLQLMMFWKPNDIRYPRVEGCAYVYRPDDIGLILGIWASVDPDSLE